MDSVAHVIHGAMVEDPHASVGKLVPFFERPNFRVEVLTYGYKNFFQVWKQNHEIVHDFSQKISSSNMIIGHSNGAQIAYLLAARGLQVDGLILINAALASDVTFPPQLKWVHVYHNESDTTLDLLKPFAPCPWGNMGRIGYRGTDHRVVNFDGNACTPSLYGHSDIFSDEKILPWGTFMSENVTRAQHF